MSWDKAPKLPFKRPNPHWLENISLTNDLVYQYKIDAKALSDVLSADLSALKKLIQVEFINVNSMRNFFTRFSTAWPG